MHVYVCMMMMTLASCNVLKINLSAYKFNCLFFDSILYFISKHIL